MAFWLALAFSSQVSAQLVASSSTLDIGKVDAGRTRIDIPLVNQTRDVIRCVPRSQGEDINIAINHKLKSHGHGSVSIGLNPTGKKRVKEKLLLYTDQQAKPIKVTIKMNVFGYKRSKCPEFSMGTYKIRNVKKETEDIRYPSLRIVNKKEKNPLYNVDPREVPYCHLTVLLDASVSMLSNNKMDLLKDQLISLIGNMRPGDYISIIHYSDQATVLADRINAEEFRQLSDTIESIIPYGYTNGQKGIESAMNHAACHTQENVENHVILMTDGAFNLGKDTRNIATYLAEKADDLDFQFSVFAIQSEKNRGDDMRRLAESGNGRFFRLDRKSNASKRMNEMLLKDMM